MAWLATDFLQRIMALLRRLHDEKCRLCYQSFHPRTRFFPTPGRKKIRAFSGIFPSFSDGDIRFCYNNISKSNIGHSCKDMTK